jgi:hypothetical protein
MAWDFEPELRNLLSSIEPTPTQKAGAVRSQNYLRELLQTGQFGNRILDTYLTGSYARDTAIAPLDDVDMVVVVDPAGWQSGFPFGKPAPEKILHSFASAIRYRYPQSSLRIQRRSICLSLNHLDIDVVPAIGVAGQADRIVIPDGDSGEWIISAPKVHASLATEINQRQMGLFKPLVKLLKSWNSELPHTAKLKSFAVETMAATLFRRIALPSLQEGLRLFFDFTAGLDNQAVLYGWSDTFGIHVSWWATELPDLAGTGGNLFARTDSERLRKFLDKARQSRDSLLLLERARTRISALDYMREALRTR